MLAVKENRQNQFQKNTVSYLTFSWKRKKKKEREHKLTSFLEEHIVMTFIKAWGKRKILFKKFMVLSWLMMRTTQINVFDLNLRDWVDLTRK